MKYFAIILCMGFLQLGYASRQDVLDTLKQEVKKIMQRHLEKLETKDKYPEYLEFLDSYTKRMKEIYSKIEEEDKSLYLQVQDIQYLKDMIGKDDFGKKYTPKTIEKISFLYNALANLQNIVTIIDHSSYLSVISSPELNDMIFQQSFRDMLKLLSEFVFKISLQLKYLEEHPSPLRAIDLVKKIFTPQYDNLLKNISNFIKMLESYIESEKKNLLH